MAAAIFNGSAVKILKNILRTSAGIELITNDSDDPSAVAKTAPAGSLYLRSGTAELYQKTDSGSSTNWRRLLNTADASSYAPQLTITTISSNVTLAANSLNLVNTSSARALTLPAVAAGRRVIIKDSTGSAVTNNITVSPASGTIDGASSLIIDSEYASVELVSDGTNWFIL